MARTVPAAVQAEFDKSVTTVGYLVEILTSPPLRFCDVATVTHGGKTFIPYDFTIRGLSGSNVARGGVLEIQNLDDTAASVFVDADMSAVKCNVWQVAPNAADATGANTTPAIKLGEFSLGALDISLDRLTVQLISPASLDAFAPRRRVDPSNGFRYALPDGTQIAWENEIYVVGEDRA